jgi:hypothetical protein
MRHSFSPRWSLGHPGEGPGLVCLVPHERAPISGLGWRPERGHQDTHWGLPGEYPRTAALPHTRGRQDCLGVGEESNSGYADDTGVWATGSSVSEVMKKLQTLADRFTAYTKGNGLALNAAKTQLLRQLANGLLLGKLGHAVAAVMAPRLPRSTATSHHLHQSVQVGINDVARTRGG